MIWLPPPGWVTEAALTLSWQRRGSGYAMSYEEALGLPMGVFERALELQGERWREEEDAARR